LTVKRGVRGATQAQLVEMQYREIAMGVMLVMLLVLTLVGRGQRRATCDAKQPVDVAATPAEPDRPDMALGLVLSSVLMCTFAGSSWSPERADSSRYPPSKPIEAQPPKRAAVPLLVTVVWVVSAACGVGLLALALLFHPSARQPLLSIVALLPSV
jgi:hypothetical protein